MAKHLKQSSKNNQGRRLSKFTLGIVGVFAVVCGALAFSIFYKTAHLYFGPKTQIVLEPDYSLVSTINPSDLETAVQILRARSRSLGVSDISFEVADDNQIIVLIPGSFDAHQFIGTTVEIGLLELVDFGEAPVPEGTTIATDSDYPYFPHTNGTKWHSILSNSEFESAYVSQDKTGRYQVSFSLTPRGTIILSEYTTKNIGNYLGIILDKVVITAPNINAPITDGKGVISGNFSEEIAQRLASFLNTDGPLPIPLKAK